MSDQSKLGIGKIITTPQNRDAIHVAIAPAVAAHRLAPGTHVGIDANGEATNRTDNAIGIIDPFLKQMVLKGETVWMLLYPGSITSLRHEWTHPAFSADKTFSDLTELQRSEMWLRVYAQKHCPYDGVNAYDAFMDNVRRGVVFYHGDDCHGLYDVEDSEELFSHLTVVLGRAVNAGAFEYSCSC